MKIFIPTLIFMLFIGCNTPDREENSTLITDPFQIGETVYVCGCPKMCCNSISRNPNGRCLCNMPLKKGIVSAIHEDIVIVTVSGRKKTIFLKSR